MLKFSQDITRIHPGEENLKAKSTPTCQLCSFLNFPVLSDAEPWRWISQHLNSLHSPMQQVRIEISDGQIMGYPYLKICSKLDFFFLVPTTRNTYFRFLSNFRFNQDSLSPICLNNLTALASPSTPTLCLFCTLFPVCSISFRMKARREKKQA